MKTHARKQYLKNKCKQLSFFILLTCITCISNAQNEEWHLLPFVPSQTLWDIHCINKDTVIAVGDNGYIIRTSNGGSHWDSIYSGVTYSLFKITFLNDSIGYICGGKGTILKTENSGITWTNISIPISLNFLSMSYINQDTGWIVGGNGAYPYILYGDKGVLIKTTNGGKSWLIDTNYTSVISSVFFLDKDTGYIGLSNNILYKTVNGGLLYDTVIQLSGIFRSIYFCYPQTGYFILSENGGGVYKTNDCGVIWNKIIDFYYPILNAHIFDSCSLYYDWWDNTMGTSSTSSTCVGINYCEDSIFDEFDLSFCAYDFIHVNYGYCIGYGRVNIDYRNCIYKKGEYDHIEEVKNTEMFKIKPNPCNGISVLYGDNFDDVLSLDVVVYNILGQKIHTKIQVNDKEIHIDLSKEKSGVYIVSIKDKNRIIENCKLIKL